MPPYVSIRQELKVRGKKIVRIKWERFPKWEGGVFTFARRLFLKYDSASSPKVPGPRSSAIQKTSNDGNIAMLFDERRIRSVNELLTAVESHRQLARRTPIWF